METTKARMFRSLAGWDTARGLNVFLVSWGGKRVEKKLSQFASSRWTFCFVLKLAFFSVCQHLWFSPFFASLLAPKKRSPHFFMLPPLCCLMLHAFSTGLALHVGSSTEAGATLQWGATPAQTRAIVPRTGHGVEIIRNDCRLGGIHGIPWVVDRSKFRGVFGSDKHQGINGFRTSTSRWPGLWALA